MPCHFDIATALISWTRCCVQTIERCYFRSDAHGDRTAIAVKHVGGEMTYHRTYRDREAQVSGETRRT